MAQPILKLASRIARPEKFSNWILVSLKVSLNLSFIADTPSQVYSYGKLGLSRAFLTLSHHHHHEVGTVDVLFTASGLAVIEFSISIVALLGLGVITFLRQYSLVNHSVTQFG
jgi:hypothetical protein